MSQDAPAVATDPANNRDVMMKRIVMGAILGMAWGAAMRAWMSVLAAKFGETSQFSWAGTFGGILIPAAIMGGVVGWAAYDAAIPGSKRWRWAVLSPVLMVIGPIIVTPNFFTILFTTGLGGGAIAVALIGIAGGFALSKFGPDGSHILVGILAVLFTLVAGFGLASGPSARDLFLGVYFILLMAMFALGLSMPSRYLPAK